jgi:PAS domain S-box-containing protein
MMWMTDENYRARMFNGEWLRFTGRSLEEELGLPWSGAEIHPEDRAACISAYDRHLKARTKLAHEYRHMDRFGHYHWIEEVAVPRFDIEGRYEGHVGCCVDVTERREQAERLGAALKEKETLLKEVHHRVKNNLQVISSLLDLQAGASRDPALKAAMREGQGRVRAMSLIHETLYQSGDFARIPFGEYLERLSRTLLASYQTRNGRVGLTVKADPVFLDLQTAVPCGLLVNELLSNSLKHGFPDGRAGLITIEVRRENATAVRLVVADDGVGMPVGLDLKGGATLGMQLVRVLSEQIGAEVRWENTGGTRVELRFAG